ncbi:CoF synthetase [Curtobacterium sp. SORGH_AS_0776]|uniref:phenylacetate--CoA ligase family protein n=1 Tax=Curtobacterium sp. SORGH_AS_0776 TaxID=3041798 RepID=UPI00285BB76E|nr:CoF synthetase [Curtobacterium sp. SORGH_AS_0776]MDR6171370.1 phenylacetate-CoA ligase [Curtobacterium sp. SORGH_AS_0776]
MKRAAVFSVVWVVETVVALFMPRVGTHKLLLTPGIEPLRWTLGRWRAWRTAERAAKRVPAYGAFLAEAGRASRLDTRGGIAAAISGLPEMDKESYVKRWSIPERCIDGRLPRRGVVVDESSGSSGTPTSWVRGPDERQATRQLLQLGFSRTAKDLPKQPFVLNAFSLGAWATGMNVTASLTESSMIKSIGPDRDKIVQTMREFGTDFTYIICSYPPFLKALFEDDRVDWSEYTIVAAFGGEGISENMRAHIEQYAQAVLGSYGASDLEINLGIETPFSVQLRRAIAASPELSAALTKQAEYGVLPMVFQFNPFGYLIETNELGELVVTIARSENISPRIRYNIHDRGHVVRMRSLRRTLREHGFDELADAAELDLPLLFHYGRSDLSVDYNGAVVAPDVVRDVVYGDPALLEAVENHRLISYEDDRGDRQLHIAFQLASGASGFDADGARGAVVAELRRLNRDFSNAIRTAPPGTLPTVAFYPYRTGPFREDGRKLKNEYVWQLPAGSVDAWDLDLAWTAPKEA